MPVTRHLIVCEGESEWTYLQRLQCSPARVRQVCWTVGVSGILIHRPCRNAKGIIRRAFSKERNFRDLRFEWSEKKQRFRQVFDAFCHRWNLYGMEKDRPLIMKITVNPTPHGTMIFIPRCWSFDGRRDLAWKEISLLHKAHGAARQGPKLSAARQQKQREKEAAKYWVAVAQSLQLRGDRREEFVLKKLGKDPRTDRSYLRRLKNLN